MEHHERIQGEAGFGGTRHEYISARRIEADFCSRILIPETKAGSIRASVNSTAFSAAALCMARLCWSAVSRASANRRCCCKCVRKCAKNARVLYVSGEESLKQIKIRAARLHISSPELYILAETDMEQIINETELLEPDILIVDSIQTVYKRDLTAASRRYDPDQGMRDESDAVREESQRDDFYCWSFNKEGTLAQKKSLNTSRRAAFYWERNPQVRFAVGRKTATAQPMKSACLK